MNNEKNSTNNYNSNQLYDYWLNNLQSQIATDLDVSLESDFNGIYFKCYF